MISFFVFRTEDVRAGVLSAAGAVSRVVVHSESERMALKAVVVDDSGQVSDDLLEKISVILQENLL